MVDGTGIESQKPSNPELARSMYSVYYKCSALLYQIGITPSGCAVWCSQARSPKLTDTEQSVLAGLLEFVWPGSRLVLDRGYSGMRTACIRKVCLCHGRISHAQLNLMSWACMCLCCVYVQYNLML